MIDRITSRPLPRLVVLTFITLSTASQTCTGAGLPVAQGAAPAEALDQQLVFALLRPMSCLIESPYSDPNAVENPLRLPVRSTISAAIAPSDISTPDTVPTADVLKVDAEIPQQKIELAPELPEETLPTLGSALPLATPLPPTAAFAMARR